MKIGTAPKYVRTALTNKKCGGRGRVFRQRQQVLLSRKKLWIENLLRIVGLRPPARLGLAALASRLLLFSFGRRGSPRHGPRSSPPSEAAAGSEKVGGYQTYRCPCPTGKVTRCAGSSSTSLFNPPRARLGCPALCLLRRSPPRLRDGVGDGPTRTHGRTAARRLLR